MANWTPAELPVELWIDAQNADSISLSKGAISHIRDISGAGRHIYQLTESRQPTLITDSSGRTLISLGSGKMMFGLSAQLHNGDWSAFAVARDFGGSGAGTLLAQDFSSYGSRIAQYLRFDRSPIGFRSVSFHTSGDLNDQVTSAIGSSLNIVGAIRGASQFAAAVNGGAPQTVTPSGSQVTGDFQFSIGARATSQTTGSHQTAEDFIGELGELFLISKAVTEEELTKIEGYLAHKWGLESQLPETHAYKSSPPKLATDSQVSKVSGVVQIDGNPAQRTVRAFGYSPATHDIDATTVTLSKSLGHDTSDPQTGEYTIDLLAGYDRQVFVVAFDDYGDPFTPDKTLAVGDRVHPTTPNGYVWECAGAGTLPSEEPAWIIDTETAQLYGTASMITRPFYRPMVHGPVMPEVVGIDKNDLLAALDAAGTLDSGAYTPETWAILDDAVQAGQAVYDDPEADQAAVDAATQAINDAIDGLEAPELVPTVIGEAFGGGFYAGDIEADGQWYKLIVAGVGADVSGLAWMTTGAPSDLPGAVSATDGLANTQTMEGDANFAAAKHCLDWRGGGYSDWYMPARSELLVMYNNLGHNKNPPAGFGSGEAEAFHVSNFYWSSTERASAFSAWYRRFSDGKEDTYANVTVTDFRVRPVRRIPFTPEGA